jgi:hypothetical protein
MGQPVAEPSVNIPDQAVPEKNCHKPVNGAYGSFSITMGI